MNTKARTSSQLQELLAKEALSHETNTICLGPQRTSLGVVCCLGRSLFTPCWSCFFIFGWKSTGPNLQEIVGNAARKTAPRDSLAWLRTTAVNGMGLEQHKEMGCTQGLRILGEWLCKVASKTHLIAFVKRNFNGHLHASQSGHGGEQRQPNHQPCAQPVKPLGADRFHLFQVGCPHKGFLKLPQEGKWSAERNTLTQLLGSLKRDLTELC